MEAITTTAGTVSLPIFTHSRWKDSSPRFGLRLRSSIFSGDKNSGSGNSEPNLESDCSESALFPFLCNRTFSQDAAMGLVLSAANVRGWTTASGMEGPPVPAGPASGSVVDRVSTFPWSLFTTSPRRRMRVAFTCNVCGQRTTRAINPHAYTDGTIFVQCCGCNVFHKLVDNLNLFHELRCYVDPSFNPNQDNETGFKYGEDDAFPII